MKKHKGPNVLTFRSSAIAFDAAQRKRLNGRRAWYERFKDGSGARYVVYWY